MTRLYLEKSIQIDAPAEKVWNVLTDPLLSRQWIRQWWPDLLMVESDWRLGDPVLWRISSGAIGARGTISAIQPPVRLTYEFEVGGRATPPRQELVTYRLAERAGRTRLSVTVGDFGDTPEHEQYFPEAADSWDRSLPKIKELSEKR